MLNQHLGNTLQHIIAAAAAAAAAGRGPHVQRRSVAASDETWRKET